MVAQEDKKTINAESDLWKKLSYYKLQFGFRTMNEAIDQAIEDSYDFRKLKQIKNYKYKRRKGR